MSKPKRFKVGALHFDAGKPRLDLIPYQSLEGEAKAMEYGVIKYARDDWRLGMVYTKLVASTLRHMTKFNDVETYDLESGVNHVEHAKACLGIALWLISNRPDLDDRQDGVRREPPTLEEVMAYRKSMGLKTSDAMLSFIRQNLERANRQYQRWKEAKAK